MKKLFYISILIALAMLIALPTAFGQYGSGGGGGGAATDSVQISDWGFITSEDAQALAYLFIEDQADNYFNSDEIVAFSTTPSIIQGGSWVSNQFIVAQDGRYEIHSILSVRNQSGQADDSFVLRIRKNRTEISYQWVDPMAYAGDGEEGQIAISGIFDFVVGDSIDLWLGNVDDAQYVVSKMLSIKQLPSTQVAGGSYWTQTGSDIYYTTGAAGIGTTTPATILHVAGSDGITVGNGTAADQNIFIVDEGTADPNKPTVFWDESDNEIESTVDWAFPSASITIGTFVLSEDVMEGLEDIYVKSTGLIKGGAVSVNGGDNTLIDITAGSGQIVNSTTDPDNPTLTSVSWTAKTGYDLTTTATAGDLVAIYLSLDSDGNVVERSKLPTAEERRNTIDLGIAARNDADQIVFAGSGPTNVIHNPGSQVQDFMEAWGAFSIDGNRIEPNAVDDLQIKKTEGSVFRNGVGFQTDGKNPHVALLAEQAPVSPFNYKLGDGTDVAYASYIDPNGYDDGTSVLATVPNNQWTIQLISVFASGLVEVLYGQEVFTKEEYAIAATSTMDFTIPTDSREAIPLAYLVLQQGDVSLPAVRFYRIPRGGTGGGSVVYWNRTGTDLSPVTDGDNVSIATQTELAAYPNFSADPTWTIFSGDNTWTYDGANDRMRPTGNLTGNTIANTGISLTSGKTYVVSLSWTKSSGSCQIYQGSGGTQISDYVDDGTLSRKWMFTASASENLFVRTTSAFHDDATTDYISALSVIEIDNAGDIIGDRLALGGTRPEYYSQLDSYDDAAMFFPPDKGILTVSDFEIRNINSGGLDFDETYARIILSTYGVSAAFGSNGYATTSLRADSNINLRTYTAGGAVTVNESSLDTDFILNGDGSEAYKYDAGDGSHTFTGLLDVNSDIIRLRTAKTPASASAIGNQGDIAWDANFIYVCVQDNVWKRSALSAW